MYHIVSDISEIFSELIHLSKNVEWIYFHPIYEYILTNFLADVNRKLRFYCVKILKYVNFSIYKTVYLWYNTQKHHIFTKFPADRVVHFEYIRYFLIHKNLKFYEKFSLHQTKNLLE